MNPHESALPSCHRRTETRKEQTTEISFIFLSHSLSQQITQLNRAEQQKNLSPVTFNFSFCDGDSFFSLFVRAIIHGEFKSQPERKPSWGRVRSGESEEARSKHEDDQETAKSIQMSMKFAQGINRENLELVN